MRRDYDVTRQVLLLPIEGLANLTYRGKERILRDRSRVHAGVYNASSFGSLHHGRQRIFDQTCRQVVRPTERDEMAARHLVA